MWRSGECLQHGGLKDAFYRSLRETKEDIQPFLRCLDQSVLESRPWNSIEWCLPSGTTNLELQEGGTSTPRMSNQLWLRNRSGAQGKHPIDKRQERSQNWGQSNLPRVGGCRSPEWGHQISELCPDNCWCGAHWRTSPSIDSGCL